MPESAVVDKPKVFGGLRGRDLLVLGVLALALRLVHLNHTPHYDEFFHVLAAQSWLRDHDFCIAQCRQPYTRGLLFTWLVIGAFKLGGISLVVARVPAVLAGTIWVLAVAAWTGRVGGRRAGWLAGGLMLLDPGVLYLSQLARFYGLHALLFWLGSAALYFALTPGTGGRRRLGWLFACAVALLLAFSLQVTTLIGVAALVLWAVIDQWRRIFDLLRRSRIAQVAAAVIVVIGVAVLIEFWISGKLAGLWRTYRWSTLWTRSEADNPKYFFNFFLEQYGWLWSLLPIAGLVALWSRPRASRFCIVVGGAVFLLHSFSGFKNYRVIYYGIPFFLALWALALSAVLPQFVSLVRNTANRLMPQRPSLARLLTVGAVGACALYLLVATEAFALTRLMLTRTDLEWSTQNVPYRGYADWDPAVPRLRALADSSAVLAVSAANKAIWYLGRADVAISQNQMYTGHGKLIPEFSRDWQAGVPLISTPASVGSILACYPTGLIVSEPYHWDRRGGIPDSTARLIEHYTTPVKLPRGTDLLAFRWTHPAPIAGADCTPKPLDPSRAPVGNDHPIEDEGA